MLNQLAFANSLAVLTAALYVLFVIIALVSPSAVSVPSSRWIGAVSHRST